MKKEKSLVAVIASAKMKKIVCVSLCLISCFIASAQIKLSFNPEKGAKYEYRMESVQNIKQNAIGQDMSMEIKMDGIFLMEIKDKTPEEIHIQMTYQRFTFIISSPMMNVKYDSKKAIKNPSEMDKIFEKMFSALIGKSITTIFTPNGSVKLVAGMGTIIENMLDAVATDGQAAALMGTQINQQFSDEAMKNMFEQSFNFYPNNAVKVGDSWNMELAIPVNNMNLGMKSTNTLKEVNRNTATIDVTGDINMDIEEGKFIGTQTGTIIVDATTGLPITSDMSLNMKGSVNTQGMEIQMEMTSNTKTSTKKKN